MTSNAKKDSSALFIVLAIIAMAVVFLLSVPARSDQPDFAHALYAKGYTASIWVNSFDQLHGQSYAAHGLFNLSAPPSDLDLRYSRTVTGAGVVSMDNTGALGGHGTATNGFSMTADGSIAIQLFANGNLAGGAEIPWSAGPFQTVPWNVPTFGVQNTPGVVYTVRVYRHVQGSVCGGEVSLDMNAECHDALTSYFALPANYHFTDADRIDTNYASAPGASTTAFCAIIRPICTVAPPTTCVAPCITPSQCPGCPSCPPPPALTTISTRSKNACAALLAAATPGTGIYKQRKDACEPTLKGQSYLPVHP